MEALLQSPIYFSMRPWNHAVLRITHGLTLNSALQDQPRLHLKSIGPISPKASVTRTLRFPHLTYLFGFTTLRRNAAPQVSFGYPKIHV